MVYDLTAKDWADMVRGGEYDFLFTDAYLEKLKDKSNEELEASFAEMIQKTIKNFDCFDFYFYIMWYHALINITGKDTVKALEVASGSTDIIPQVMDRIFHKESQYISSNMNKKLTEGLNERIGNLLISTRVIEDDALLISKYTGADFFDMVLFQHSANDIIQAILCERERIDTINSDWMETLPEMIRILQNEVGENTLEDHAKPGFIALLSSCLETLAYGGYMVFNHHMYQWDLDMGYPYTLWHDMIPMVRKWIAESDLKMEEVEFEGFDKQWWLFLRKKQI